MKKTHNTKFSQIGRQQPKGSTYHSAAINRPKPQTLYTITPSDCTAGVAIPRFPKSDLTVGKPSVDPNSLCSEA